MTRPTSLSQIKTFLQNDDENVKTNCFRLLLHIMGLVFNTNQDNDWQSMRSFSAYNSNKDACKNEEQELQEIKKSVKDELSVFMSDIVQSVIAFEFSTSSGVSTTDK
mmetsp:Transcript_8906/g.10938  ORF Transcript_8906/g.10938 Transcript_8906/m.10938 type:complete len:107 (-) Transcript_8906:832-1152(-)